MNERILEIQNLYKEGIRLLSEAGIPDETIDAWYLMEYVTGISRASYYGNPGQELTAVQADSYLELIRKRCSRIPLQHLTHEQYFMGYPFYVNEDVLIPRQDTEILVEEALKKLKWKLKVMDMCTGSGCILISFMKMAGERFYLKEITGVGIDLSGKALKVARKNQETLLPDGDITFLQSNLFENVPASDHHSYDLILSNPPYIRTAEIEKLQEEVKLHDPLLALDGTADGLHFYREIIRESRKYLRSGGTLMFEIGYDQGEDVKKLMEQAGFQEILIKKDLAGLDRVVLGLYNEE